MPATSALPTQPVVAKLVLRSDKLNAEWPVLGRATVGRAPGNSVVLNDREVSKEHAIVSHERGEWFLRDLQSANGTFVNGRRITELKLRDGDELLLGSTRLTFRSAAAAATDARTHVTLIASEPALIASAPVEEDRGFRPAGDISSIDALRRDYEKLRIAHQFHREVGGVRDPRVILNKVLDVAFDLLPADNGVIMMKDSAVGQLRVVAVKSRKEQEGGVLLSETLLDKVVKTRQGVLTADAMLDSRFNSAHSIVSRGVRSAMAVPITGSSADYVRGVLFLDTRAQTSAFNEKDLRLLTAIGTQAGITVENAEVTTARDELTRYLPKALVDQAVRGTINIDKAGTQMEGTILFADIRSFTSLSEKQPASDTVALLNRFFELMVDEVFAEEGVLDKFLGDGLMALFGMPVRQEDAGASPALRCALKMQERMQELNAERAAAGLQPLGMGVGVNTGVVIVGTMGSMRRMEYTAIGDPVNVASRLCGVAAGGEVLCTEATAAKVRGKFRLETMPPQKVKGKERPVNVFRVRKS